MSIETAAVAGGLGGPAGAGLADGGIAAGSPAEAGYGVSLSDFGAFQGAMSRLDAQPVQQLSAVAEQAMRPFDHINAEAAQMSSDAQAAKVEGRAMTPSEIVSLTMRAQEFMFHCQLMSNIANRTSDGLQQLFRQQS